jgi:exportin-2 (importin alpha re-exporter)
MITIRPTQFSIIYSSVSVNSVPVLKADAIKYVMIFRSILPKEVVVGSLPLLVQHLKANSVVVHTYAACAIDKILLLKENDKAV